MKINGKAGCIGRFKPLHLGGAVMLETICEQADEVIIGVGSANKYNVRNPFTAEESKEMIETVLKPKYDNFKVVLLPDYAHIPKYCNGKKWLENILKTYDKLNYFVTGNEYVARLLKDHYEVIHPGKIIPSEKWVKLRATEVRIRMARNENWKELVPEPVAKYLNENKLVDRFRKEFGLQTIAEYADYDPFESAEKERLHTMRA